MNKTAWLTLLVCVNLVLITGIVLFGSAPRTALAQGTGLAGNYMIVTGAIQTGFDALYVLDLRERTLHAFFFVKGSNNIEYGGYRDLERDFRNN
jgi:hypothetical protein